MIRLVVTSLIVILTAGIVSKVVTWRRAFALAKSADFPVFLSPVHMTDMWWLMIHKRIGPFLDRLPTRWTRPWLSMARIFDIWHSGHEPFAQVGSDTFILSTPRDNILWTCDPKIIYQLEASYPKFQKAIEMLKFLDIYGPTVASVEGQAWKAHRKVIMSGFNPSTNANVWRTTSEETTKMVGLWLKQDGVIRLARHWTNRLTLHVLSIIFFRKPLSWSEDASGVAPTPKGYELSFEQALFTVLQRLGVLLMVPRFLLSSLPFKNIRETYVAFTELTKYIQELIFETEAHLDEVAADKNKSILECIVSAGSSSAVLDGEPALPEASILGNVFFVFSAGHETAGNTMSFAMILLALYPEYQAKIQEDLDRLRSQRSQNEWTVEREYQALQNGWLGAALKEVLRLYCVVQFLPRRVTAPIDVIDSQGKHHTVPEGTMVALGFSAAFQNPSTWPRREMSDARRAELHNSPAADFDPSRWLEADNADNRAAQRKEGPAHFPFGQGPHVCPGRLFALVEMTAFIATVLADFSLELVVDEKTTNSCGGDETKAWEKTRDQAIRTMEDDVVSNQNIELHTEIPLRLRKRAST